MSFNSVVASLISSIKVALKHKISKGKCVCSKYALNIVNKLQSACIIQEYCIVENEKGFKYIEFVLQKYKDVHLLIDIKMVSKPSKRIYCSCDDLRLYLRYYSDMLVSTHKGVLNYKECKDNNVGGEIILLYR